MPDSTEEDDVNESVDEHDAELSNEDPEIVQVEADVWIFLVDPAPSAGANVEVVVHAERDDGADVDEEPEGYEEHVEVVLFEAGVEEDCGHGVGCYGKAPDAGC